MKRGAERGGIREMGSPQKRARNLGYELRLLIPSRVAGSVIGKGGGNITRLRTENKATISVPDSGQSPERLISIAADDQETTLTVLTQIVPLIEEASKDRNRSGGDNADVVEIRVLFHHTVVGCIIGKAGAKIKELRDTTSAQIKVYGSCCPRSTDRVVAVSGSVENVLNAIKQIVALVNDNPVKGVTDQYDPHNFDEMFAVQYGGFGEARGGFGGGGGGGGRDQGYGRPMGGGRMMGGPQGRPPRGGGYRDGGGRGGGGGGGGGGGRNRGDPHRSNGGGRHEDYDDSYAEEDRQTTQVTIPKEYAGAIIGKGGSRIRRIRAESSASIQIDEALPGADDRIITITGAPGQIRMAQYLLQQSVKDHGERKQF